MAKVQFNDVSFSYGDKKIIQNLSLEVNDGFWIIFLSP